MCRRYGGGAAGLLLLLAVVCVTTSGIPTVAGQQQRGGYQQPQQNRRSSNTPAPTRAPTSPPVQQTRLQGHGANFQYNPASAAVTELARSIGSILGQQHKAAVFSPVSIASALSLMLIGAEQQTKSELIHVLGFHQYAKHLDNIHQLYSDMLNDLAKKEFDLVPPPWRTANPCYDPDEEDDADAAAFPLEKDEVSVANAVFVQDQLRLNASFLYYSQRYYNSTAETVPFATNPAKAAAVINDWASRSTHGKIRDILSESVAAEAEMIVASALYFKGLWSEPFEQQATEQKPFFPDGYGRESKPMTTMSTVGCYPYYDARELDAKIVGLSYQGNKSALYIIMPNNSTRQKMQDFQRRLTPAMIGDLVSKMVQRKMYLQLPKMQITNTINLRDVLQRLGLRTIFNRGQSDLSGMVHQAQQIELFQTRFGGAGDPPNGNDTVLFPTDYYYTAPDADTRRGSGGTPLNGNNNINNQNAQAQLVPGVPAPERTTGPQLHVSEFIHRVELDINEKGTEGGAITTSTIFRALPSIHFRVDAPFLLLLGHDETRLPLFYGSIYDPTP
uniref:Serpin domain-containing protein n=1 Tax=Anopheles dirus TaxID=7168 RepID=A0A182NF76_9DIPT